MHSHFHIHHHAIDIETNANIDRCRYTNYQNIGGTSKHLNQPIDVKSDEATSANQRTVIQEFLLLVFVLLVEYAKKNEVEETRYSLGFNW